MTAPNEYEPSAEAVEALAKELCGAFNTADTGGQHWNRLTNNGHDGYRAEARFILRRQHARERGLLGAVKAAMEDLPAFPFTAGARLAVALAAHAKLDAPKVPEAPTLLEAAKALTTVGRGYPESNVTYVLVGDWNALKAAVEREEKREKR